MRLPQEIVLTILRQLNTPDLISESSANAVLSRSIIVSIGLSQTSKSLYHSVVTAGLPAILVCAPDKRSSERSPHYEAWYRLSLTERGRSLMSTVRTVLIRGWISDNYDETSPSRVTSAPSGVELRNIPLHTAQMTHLRFLEIHSMAMPWGWEKICFDNAATLVRLELKDLWYGPKPPQARCSSSETLVNLREVSLSRTLRAGCGNQDGAVEKAILKNTRCTDMTIYCYEEDVVLDILQLAGRDVIDLELDFVMAGAARCLPELRNIRIVDQPGFAPDLPASVETITLCCDSAEFDVPSFWQEYLRPFDRYPALRELQVEDIDVEPDSWRSYIEYVLDFSEFLEERNITLIGTNGVRLTTEYLIGRLEDGWGRLQAEQAAGASAEQIEGSDDSDASTDAESP